MHFSLALRSLRVRIQRACLCAFLFLPFTPLIHAGVIRGTVTDTSGATVVGATVVLTNGDKFVGKTVSTADGSYQLVTGQSGRFSLVITAQSFRQLAPPSFYAGAGASVERNLVMEPEWVHQSIVVTATGTPTPQQQTSAATNVLGTLDLGLRDSFVDALRQMPGTVVTQSGQTGAQTSLFIRGGASDANKVMLDGVDAGDLGGRFDFGPLATTGIDSAEVYRGPASDLYGADASSGAIVFSTKRGISSSPSLRLAGDAGNFQTSHEEAEVSGSHKTLDYFGAASWLQTGNSLPNDEFHVGTGSGNFGWQPLASTQIRGTVHYGFDGTGVPNTWEFYHVADNATQKDQDLFISGSIDNQTTVDFHNSLRYGLSRKREQYSLWQPSGQLITYYDDPVFGPEQAYFGNAVTFTGANGYTASGRAMLDFPEEYPFTEQFVSNRDQLVYQGDFRFTPHLVVLAGFHYEDERGVENIPSFAINESTERTNYVYLVGVHGDFKNRVFYTLGGSLEHYSYFGVQTSPRAGLSIYAIKPRHGIFSGTRVLFNFGDAVREPTLTDQFGSLYQFLADNGDQSIAQQLHISPLAAPSTRTYEGGFEQDFFSNRLIFRSSYFHNQFGRQIESVGGRVLPDLLPGLTPDQRQQLISALGYYYDDDYGLSVNSEAYRAQGIETTVEGGIGSSLFLRGGYTWTEAVVQRSFDSDNESLSEGFEPTYNGIPIGALSPLKGARPFRIPPHSGFVSASFQRKRWTLVSTASLASRSDDSTFLEFEDLSGGNSLLLPNRNLDHGYANITFGGSFQLFPRLAIYANAENLASDRHIAPIGYESLPFNYRGGLRLRLGKGSGD
ncbi:MAG TPA: TonB-dependent receptor [Acidobacteriaceae bacterium]|jgi:iron complex outermembrane receptor protein/vitamin B12 transporter|nr:TonB-dependent receptor [Acidobacteriaceae bacterium]